jgi:hypothetical protein
MREPSTQTRLLASPPVFYGAWGLALWLGYQWTLDTGIWPLFLMLAFPMAGIMNAEREVKAYKRWKREWDAMAGAPPRPKQWPLVVGVIIGIPILIGLANVGQHQGTQAVIGVLMVTLGPLLLLALLLKLWGRVLRTFRRRADKVQPVAICISRPLLPVPTLRDAYHSLPAHCALVLGASA